MSGEVLKMRKKFLQKILLLALSVGFLFLVHLRNGGNTEQMMAIMCYSLLIAILTALLYDGLDKVLFEPELLTWQYALAEGLGLAGVWMHGRFFYAEEPMPALIFAIVGIVLYGGSVIAFCTLYNISVLDRPEWDMYKRKKVCKKLQKMATRGQKDKIENVLRRVCRYWCIDHDYRKGSRYECPFDTEKLRTWKQMSKSKVLADQTLAAKVAAEISLMADKLIKEGYNCEDVAALLKAEDKEKVGENFKSTEVR